MREVSEATKDGCAAYSDMELILSADVWPTTHDREELLHFRGLRPEASPRNGAGAKPSCQNESPRNLPPPEAIVQATSQSLTVCYSYLEMPQLKLITSRMQERDRFFLLKWKAMM